jgi:hypothetical protein
VILSRGGIPLEEAGAEGRPARGAGIPLGEGAEERPVRGGRGCAMVRVGTRLLPLHMQLKVAGGGRPCSDFETTKGLFWATWGLFWGCVVAILGLPRGGVASYRSRPSSQSRAPTYTRWKDGGVSEGLCARMCVCACGCAGVWVGGRVDPLV